MFTLGAGKTLAASGPTAVNFFVFGDAVTTTDAFDILAKGSVSVAATVIYTATAVQGLVKTLVLFNTAGTPSTIFLYANGTVTTDRFFTATIPAGGTLTYGAAGWQLTDSTGATIVSAAALSATGDATGTQSGSNLPLTLATVNGAPGTFGSATAVSQVTVNGKGLATTVASVAIQIAESQVTNLVTDLAGKQPVGNYITALTGDGAATGPGSVAFTLATVNGAPGTFGSATQVSQVTVNGKGLATTVASVSIQIAESQVTNLVTDLAGKQPTGNYITALTGDGVATGPGSVAFTLATVNGAPGTFGSATQVSQVTVNGKGLATTVASVSIQIAESQVTNLVTDLAAKVPTSRLINTTAPLTGGGDLSADRTIAITAAATTAAGSMSAVDKIRMGQIVDAQADLGFVGDLITTNSTSSCSTGTPNQITDSASPFTPAGFPASYYVGKRITLAGAGAAGAVYVGTVTAVSAGTATVSPNISTTVTNRICSFGTDNTAAITALNTLINTTRGVYPGTKILYGNSLTNAYGFPIPVLLNQTAQVEGVGSGYTADTGDYSRLGGTRLAWWGTSVDGGVTFGAFWTFSPTGVQSLKRPAMRHLWLDCRNGDQNSALIGLKMASCQGWSLDEFFVMDPGAIGIWLDIATSPTEARDCTRGMATGLGFRCLDNTSGPTAVTLTPTTTSTAVSIAASTSLTLAAANGLRASGSDYIWVQSTAGRPFLARYTGGGGTTTLTGVACSAEDAVHVPTTAVGSNVVQASPSNSTAIYLNGGSGANTCCNTFVQTEISHAGTWGPAAVDFGNSDSNDFQSCYINGGTRAVFGAAPNNRMTKPGVRFNGSNVANTLAARNNTFKGGDPGSLPTTNGGVENMGLTNAGALLVAPAGPNYWDRYQLGNGAPMPVVEQGASYFWTNNGGFSEGSLAPSFTGSFTAAGNVLLPIAVPPQGWQVGTTITWVLPIAKTTAVGTILGIAVRQNSTPVTGGGTAILNGAFTGTAVADSGVLTIVLSVVGPLGGACVPAGRYTLSHNLAITGLGTGAVTLGTVVGTPSTTGGHIDQQPALVNFNSAAPGSGPTFLYLDINTGSTLLNVYGGTVTCTKAANP